MDLIDREELLKRFELTSQANGNAIRYEIKCAPTVDAEPVRHGKWIALPKEFDTFCKCSLCNYPVDFNWGQTNYCPNCGAKMDGE